MQWIGKNLYKNISDKIVGKKEFFGGKYSFQGFRNTDFVYCSFLVLSRDFFFQTFWSRKVESCFESKQVYKFTWVRLNRKTKATTHMYNVHLFIRLRCTWGLFDRICLSVCHWEKPFAVLTDIMMWLFWLDEYTNLWSQLDIPRQCKCHNLVTMQVTCNLGWEGVCVGGGKI